MQDDFRARVGLGLPMSDYEKVSSKGENASESPSDSGSTRSCSVRSDVP